MPPGFTLSKKRPLSKIEPKLHIQTGGREATRRRGATERALKGGMAQKKTAGGDGEQEEGRKGGRAKGTKN